jgi:hypothetical protein
MSEGLESRYRFHLKKYSDAFAGREAESAAFRWLEASSITSSVESLLIVALSIVSASFGKGTPSPPALSPPERTSACEMDRVKLEEDERRVWSFGNSRKFELFGN